jgi:hypothetical protein
MKSKKARQKIWRRERSYATQLTYWKSFAIETRACAEFLLAAYLAALESSEPVRAFFVFKYVRMLMAYSLENLAKGLLLNKDDDGEYLKENKITWGKRAHDLLWLLGKLGLDIPEEDRFYLQAWSKSAEWFGKYPFPSEMNRVLDEYEPVETQERLIRRRLRGKREFLYSDLLHQQIGSAEVACFERTFSELLDLYEGSPLG